MRIFFICCCFIFINTMATAQFGGSQGGNGSPGNNPGNGNATLPPSGANVIMYKDFKYSGMSRAMAQGNFNTQTLGFLSGNVSSIYIPQGYNVTVYDNRGTAKVFTTSSSNLAQYGWDNKIISGVIQISRPGNGNGGSQGGNGPGFGNGGSHGGNGIPPGPVIIPAISVATLYKDPHFRGNFVRCGTGRLIHLGQNADRAISSIQLMPGYAIRVYSGLSFSGHYRTFISSVPNLYMYGWNDIIRSVEVMRL